jgi:hypothetical protein
MTLMLLGASAACNSDDSTTGDPTAAAEASPVSDTFDYNKLSAIVLRPEDLLSPVSAGTAGFASGGGGSGVSFTAWYGDDSLLIQATVGRYADPVKRELDFDHIRRSIATLTQNETNYDLPGADLAFSYATAGENFSSSILAFKGEYFMLIVTQSGDGTRADEASNRENIAAYADVVFTRLEGLIADPDSVTPIEGAAQYATPTVGVPASTPASALPTQPAGALTPIAP